jgi:hypothetical protein
MRAVPSGDTSLTVDMYDRLRGLVSHLPAKPRMSSSAGISSSILALLLPRRHHPFACTIPSCQGHFTDARYAGFGLGLAVLPAVQTRALSGVGISP